MSEAPTLNGGGRAQEPSVGALLGTLAKQTGSLVRQEVHLASIEMTHKAKRAARDVEVVGFGGAVAFAGFLGLLAAAICGLGTALPIWAAALIIGGGVFVLGGVIALLGLKALQRADVVPRTAVETLRQDRTWMKEQLR